MITIQALINDVKQVVYAHVLGSEEPLQAWVKKVGLPPAARSGRVSVPKSLAGKKVLIVELPEDGQ